MFPLILITSLLVSQSLALFNVYEDIFATPKYVVRYDNSNELTHSEAYSIIQHRDNSNNGSYETLRSGDGHEYLCHIPSPAEEHDDSPQLEEALGSKLNELSVVITNELENGLLFYMANYWTYVFSQKGELAQYNGDPSKYMNPDTYKFILGRHNGKIDFPKLEAKKQDGIVYLAHKMDNGSTCDVTGKPRTVEIQYVCDAASDVAKLLSVKEVKTCQYQARIAVPSLCKDDIFRQNEENFNQITCTKIVQSKLGTSQDHTEVTARRQRINIMDYTLIHIDHSLFLGKQKDSSTIIIDSSVESHKDFYERLINSFIKWFPRHFIKDQHPLQYLEKTMNFRYHAMVYDMRGRYLRTVYIEASFNQQHHLILFANASSRDFNVDDSNIELLHPSPYTGGDTLEQQKASIDTTDTDTSAGSTDDSIDQQGQILHDLLIESIKNLEEDDQDPSEIVVVKLQRDKNGGVTVLAVETEPGDDGTDQSDADQDTIETDQGVLHDEL